MTIGAVLSSTSQMILEGSSAAVRKGDMNPHLNRDLLKFFDQLNKLLAEPEFAAWVASHKSGMHWSCCFNRSDSTCRVQQLLNAMVIPNWREYVERYVEQQG